MVEKQVMWLTENRFVMHNLKTRIKRRKESPKKSQSNQPEPSSTSVEADWQFVNFNPFFYGARRPSTEHNPSSALGTTESQAPQQQKELNEDFYEFPTSTKLKQCTTTPTSTSSKSTYSGSPNRNSREDILLEGNQILRNSNALLKGDQPDCTNNTSSSNVKYQRRSLNAAFDLLPHHGNQVQFEEVREGHVGDCNNIINNPKSSLEQRRSPRPHSGIGLVSLTSGCGGIPPPPRPPPPGLVKSNSVVSSSSSSSITSFTSGGAGSNPVSRSSSRGKDKDSRSTFYIPPALPPKGGNSFNSNFMNPKGPPPPPPPPYPLKGLGPRPHSWDLDLKAGTITVHQDPEDDVLDFVKKPKKSSFYHYGRNKKEKEKEKLSLNGLMKTSGKAPAPPPPPPPVLKPKKYGAPQLPIHPSLAMSVALSSSPLATCVMTSANGSNNGALVNLGLNLSRIST